MYIATQKMIETSQNKNGNILSFCSIYCHWM